MESFAIDRQEMIILQSNVDYLTNKVDSKDIEKIPDEDNFKYDQDIVANQGTIIPLIMILNSTKFWSPNSRFPFNINSQFIPFPSVFGIFF